MTPESSHGLSLAPFRALRFRVDGDRLGRLLCPPYDVINAAQRAALLAGDPDNAVALILPQGDDPYAAAARRLDALTDSGAVEADAEPALYVYEMRAGATATRGLLGAVELRDPADGVILPHENTMAGPVADRLALMDATDANLEPIYLVYDGGGAASQVVADADQADPIALATTPDGTVHRLWAVTDPDVHAAVAADLAGRRALIADGHHRYATYRQLQSQRRAEHGPGPWDRGLTLLVDSSSYGPQVHAIHRVLHGVPLADVFGRTVAACETRAVATPEEGLLALDEIDGFAAVLTDGDATFVASDVDPEFAARATVAGEPPALADLDVTLLHRVLIESVWGVADTPESVGYAHDVEEAIASARASGGTAVLIRATPVDAVAAVAAAGARMPRKSTLFTPKPASGLVMRRFADQT